MISSSFPWIIYLRLEYAKNIITVLFRNTSSNLDVDISSSIPAYKKKCRIARGRGEFFSIHSDHVILAYLNMNRYFQKFRFQKFTIHRTDITGIEIVTHCEYFHGNRFNSLRLRYISLICRFNFKTPLVCIIFKLVYWYHCTLWDCIFLYYIY